jgi:dimethylhistidine N-methyltransferase
MQAASDTPRFLQMVMPDAPVPVQELPAGLRAQPARIAPKYFYDALGSRLFDAITELPEYYPTRTEAAIFTRHLPAIADAVLAATGPAPTLVDLGAGDGTKAERFFAALQPRRYVAVDISADYLRGALQALRRRHPALDIRGLGQDFSTRLAWPEAWPADGPRLVFYPGSSIGNFDRPSALRLLQQARTLAAGGALLIGVDLVKPAAVLEPAYDDALGVTAAFNLNLLRHVNRLLGSDFDVRDWQHVAFFNPAADPGRIEMHLQARHATTVRWPGGERRFEAGDRIHTENSAKWQRPAFEALLHEAGYGRVQHWTDEAGWFAVCLASAG